MSRPRSSRGRKPSGETFDNLINNAIKYGAEGKKVLIQVFAKDDIVTVSVTNYGYVIPADELPLIFNKFYRVEQSRSTNNGGNRTWPWPSRRISWICTAVRSP